MSLNRIQFNSWYKRLIVLLFIDWLAEVVVIFGQICVAPAFHIICLHPHTVHVSFVSVFVLFLSFHFTLTSTVLWSGAPPAFSYLATPKGIYLTVLLFPPLFSEIIFLDR